MQASMTETKRMQVFFCKSLKRNAEAPAMPRLVLRRGLSQMQASMTETKRMQLFFARVLSEMQGRMAETRWKQGGCKSFFARVLGETQSQTMGHIAETRWRQGGCKWFFESPGPFCEFARRPFFYLKF